MPTTRTLLNATLTAVALCALAAAAGSCRSPKKISTESKEAARQAPAVKSPAPDPRKPESAAPTEGRESRVVATVGSETILLSDVDREIERQAIGKNREPDVIARLRAKLLEDLIDDKLLVQACAKYSITATEAQVDANVAEVKQRLGSEEAFAAFLTRESWTLEQHRERARMAVLRKSLRDSLYPVEVTEDEMRKEYDAKLRKAGRGGKVRIRQIQLNLPGAAPEEDWAAAEARLTALRKEIEGGVKFEEAARRDSQHPSAGKGGDMGWATHARHPKELFAPAFDMTPGQIQGPLRTSTGAHLIQLVEKADTKVGTFEEEGAALKSLIAARKRQENQAKMFQRLRQEIAVSVSL